MQLHRLHSWTLSPKEAILVQKKLASQVMPSGRPNNVKLIAGADLSMQRHSAQAYAGVVVMTFPDLEVVEERGEKINLSFPYIPGLLAFREAPPLLKIFAALRHEPDLIFIDGQGIAHPRGMGIASHVGLVLDKASIGCAKSLLFGRFDPPGPDRPNFSYLYGSEEKIIGAAVRTRSQVQPVFVSSGHRIDLATAIHYVLACCRGYRIPDPIRHAHQFVNAIRRAGGKRRIGRIARPILSAGQRNPI